MNCRRSSEIDLPGFLDEPRRPEFAAFREHYPRCRDCSAEVRAWMALQQALRTDGAAAAHPEPELLARLHGDALGPAERGPLEAHLATCAACRDELRALQRWTPAPQLESAPARVATPGRAADWRAALRRLLWSPAFAYALLVLVLAPTLYRQVIGGSIPIEQVPQPTGIPEAEKERGLEQPPAAAAESKVVAKLAREAAPARKPSAEGARAAAPPPPAVAYAPPAPAPVAPGRLRSERRATRDAARGEADREIAALGYSTSAPGQDALAPEPAAAAPERASVAEEVLVAKLPSAARLAPSASALALRTGEVPIVSAASARAGLHLLVAAPAEGPGEVEIRVVGPGGGRELRERRPSSARNLAVELPPDWLAPGRYQASVRRLGSVTDEARYAFEVEEETPPRR